MGLTKGVGGQENIIEEMARAGLPSTLCKCFYVFVTLPPVKEEEEKGVCLSPVSHTLLKG